MSMFLGVACGQHLAGGRSIYRKVASKARSFLGLYSSACDRFRRALEGSMRRWWILALMLGWLAGPVAAAPMFPDVPDMWAKDAVAALAAKGILEGYPDGTFKGDRAATRYEVAVIVARLLARMEQEHATFATRADLDDVRKLVTQLREELDALGVRVQSLEDNVGKLDRRVTELERITFYGSLDARFASIQIGNRGLPTGINGGPSGGGVVVTPALLAPIGGFVVSAPFVTAVGVPAAFSAATAGGTGRPTVVNAFAWNAGNFANIPVIGSTNASYNIVAGSAYSLGGWKKTNGRLVDFRFEDRDMDNGGRPGRRGIIGPW